MPTVDRRCYAPTLCDHRNGMPLRSIAPTLILLVSAFGWPTSAYGDWPMARHDPQRLAVADGAGNLEDPASFWRFYTGGSLGARSALALDVDQDGSLEVVMATAGRVFAKRPTNGDQIWKSEQLAIIELVGVSDLDGDGVRELVARSMNRVFVLRLSDGQVVWAEAEGEMGTVGGVRLADLSGDGYDDIVIQECGCCAVIGDIPGVVYRFAGPGASVGSPALMWQLPHAFCGGAHAGTVVHMRSATQGDLLLGTQQTFELHAGSNGVTLGASPLLSVGVQAAYCVPVPEANGLEAALCLFNQAGTTGDRHRAYLLRYQATNLIVQWSVDVGDEDGGMKIPPSLVADPDADGQLELLLGGRLSDGSDAAYVYDIDSGNVLAQLNGHAPVGFAPTVAGGGVVLTSTNGELHVWSFDRTAAEPLVLKFTMPGRAAMSDTDWAQAARSGRFRRLVTFDANSDGVEELVTVDADLGIDVISHDLAGGSAQAVRSYAVPEGASAIGAWRFDQHTSAPRFGVAQSDGNLHLMTDEFAPVSGNPGFGAKFAGYYSGGNLRQLTAVPLLADLNDGGPPALLVQTSRGTLERLDATEATFASGPVSLWSRSHTNGPIVVPGLAGGSPGIAVIDHEGDEDVIVALAAMGNELWQSPLPGVTLTDLVYGNANDDGVPDLFIEWGGAGDGINTVRAISGANGSVLWDSMPWGPYNRQPMGGAVADWNGDGIDDYVYQADATRIVDGASGLEILSSPPGFSYNMPIIDDVDDDGEDEVTLYAGFKPASTLDHDLQSALWVGEDDRPMAYGTIIRCPGQAPTLVGGDILVPPRLKFTLLAGAEAGSFETIYLADGNLYEDLQDAIDAGAVRGQLSAPAAHTDLAGDGRLALAVGSSDGWLYVLDACDRTLRHAVPFDAPVGSVIYGDSDADGFDEMIVSVADGHVYSLEQAPVAPVEAVIDTDPPSGITDVDVDEIITFDTLYVSWSAVSEADSYEVAVVRDPIDGGGYISAGPWVDVGNVTSAPMTGLPLQEGHRYFAAVRAVVGADRSPDRLSDGVTVVAIVQPPVEPGVGPPVLLVGRSCVYFCAATPMRGSVPWGWIVGIVGIVALRRRYRRDGQ